MKRTVSIDKIVELAKKISSDPALTVCLNKPVREPRFTQIVLAFCKHLPKDILKETVHGSLFHLLGQTLTYRLLRKEAWRLASNKWRLRNWRSVPPWHGQPAEELAPLQVLGATHTRRNHNPATRLRLSVLAGSASTETFDKVWTLKFCRVVAQRLGFTPPWGDHPFLDARQLVDMRFYVTFTPELCREGLNFEEIWCNADEATIQPPSMFQYNRDLLKLRDRATSEHECVGDYPPDFLCHQCPFGKDQCPLAVHAITYVRRLCDQCHEVEWFDPQAPGTSCLACTARAANRDH